MNRLGAGLLTTLFLLSFVTAAVIQQSSSPSRAGTSKTAKSLILVDTDDVCQLFLDDSDQGVITPSLSRRVSATPGDHILKCTVENVPDLVWRKVVEVKAGSQAAAVISLKALHIQYDQAVEQQKKQQEQAVAAEEKRKAEAAAAADAARRAEEELPHKVFEQFEGTWQGSIQCSDNAFNYNDSFRLRFTNVENRSIAGDFYYRKVAAVHSPFVKPIRDESTTELSLEIVKTNMLQGKPDGYPFRATLIDPDRIEVRTELEHALDDCSQDGVIVLRRQ